MTGFPGIAEVQEIVEDAVSTAGAANRRITNGYHRLSEASRAAMDAGPNLDWCGFAKWSSHTVGLDLDPTLTGLRTDEIADQILAQLPPGLEVFRPRIVGLLQTAVAVEDGLVRKALRGGNALIFREMGTVFTLLIEQLARPSDGRPDESIASEIIDLMQAGGPKFLKAPIHRSLFVDADEKPLAQAIAFYLRAAREPAHRAELMLAGNMLFSVYEQTRADRLITIGTCAPVRARIVHVLRGLSLLNSEAAERLLLAERGGPDPTTSSFVKDLAAPFAVAVEESVAATLTDRALVVEIAGERVRLGHPEVLLPQVVPTLPEVTAVLAAQESDAPRTWLDLRYRLAFIARYFAARQQKPGATEEPLLPA